MKSSKIWVCISGEYSPSMAEPKTTTEKKFLNADEASQYISQWADNAAWERGVNMATAESKGYIFSVNTFSATVYDEDDMSYEFCVAHPIDYAELTR